MLYLKKKHLHNQIIMYEKALAILKIEEINKIADCNIIEEEILRTQKQIDNKR